MSANNEMRDKIKARVRKLLNLAGDAGAFDGEIDAAMLAAEKLMQEYQLERAECEATEIEAGAAPRVQDMQRTKINTTGANVATWEIKLAHAINTLLGTTQYYNSGRTYKKVGAFAVRRATGTLVYYGPADDVQLATEMHTEWAGVIATCATGKYRGCLRGDGAQYAYGFASALHDKALANQRERAKLVTPATTALVRVGQDHSLAALQQQTRGDASTWLRVAEGINLTQTSRRSVDTGSSAYANGRADGARAEFGAKRTARLSCQ